MKLFEYINQRIKKFTLLDLKLLQLSAVFLVLAIVKLIPEIMNLNILWFILLSIITGCKPFLKLIKK